MIRLVFDKTHDGFEAGKMYDVETSLAVRLINLGKAVALSTFLDRQAAAKEAAKQLVKKTQVETATSKKVKVKKTDAKRRAKPKK